MRRRNKEIEEMANDIWTSCPTPDMNIGEATYTAEKLYNIGYRKQSVGEWIVTDADSGSFGEYEPFIEFKCPKCGNDYGIQSGQYDWQYGEPIPWISCPLCGAKMKGGE